MYITSIKCTLAFAIVNPIPFVCFKYHQLLFALSHPCLSPWDVYTSLQIHAHPLQAAGTCIWTWSFVSVANMQLGSPSRFFPAELIAEDELLVIFGFRKAIQPCFIDVLHLDVTILAMAISQAVEGLNVSARHGIDHS